MANFMACELYLNIKNRKKDAEARESMDHLVGLLIQKKQLKKRHFKND